MCLRLSSRLAAWALKVETDCMGIAAGLQDRVVQSFADQADAVLMDFSKEAFAENDGLYGRYRCLKISERPSLLLMVASEPSHSGQAHQKVKSLLNRGDAQVISQMKELAGFAQTAAAAFEAHDFETLGRTMRDNAHKRVEIYGREALGPHNLAIIEACDRAGCFPNFTGSGGAAIVLLPGQADKSLELLGESIGQTGLEFELLPLD